MKSRRSLFDSVNCVVSFLSLERCTGIVQQSVLRYYFSVLCTYTPYEKHPTMQDDFCRFLSVPLLPRWSILSCKRSSWAEELRPVALRAISTSWNSVTVISDISVHCFHYCLIYVRDALRHKSQKFQRVLSVACPRARKLLSTFILLPAVKYATGSSEISDTRMNCVH